MLDDVVRVAPARDRLDDGAEHRVAEVGVALALAGLGRDRIVMVGRAAAAVLSREKNVLHARLVASIAHRTLEAMRTLDLDETHAAAEVEEHDTNRERYHREFYDRDWNDPVNYHMVLNTELLGTDGAGDLVVARAKALGW